MMTLFRMVGLFVWSVPRFIFEIICLCILTYMAIQIIAFGAVGFLLLVNGTRTWL